MKKISNGNCSPIFFRKPFLITGKRGITVFRETSPDSFEEYYHTSKIKDVEFFCSYNDTIFAKNSSGEFLIYDFNSNDIISGFKYEQNLVPVEMNFCSLSEFEIFDIAYSKSGHTVCNIIDICKKEIRSETIPLDPKYKISSVVFEKTKAICYLTLFNSKEKGQLILCHVNIRDLSMSFEKIDRPPEWVVFYDPTVMISRKQSCAVVKTNAHEYVFESKNGGCFIKAKAIDNKHLALIYSNEIAILNPYKTGIIEAFPIIFASDICRDNKRIFLSSWKGLYIQNNVFALE